MKPHKHAELIKAWADGAEIQRKLKIIAGLIHYPQCWDDVTYPKLEDAVIAICQNFNCTNEDEIKPEPKPDVVVTEYLQPHYFLNAKNPTVIGDRSKKPNIKFVFDGETGELKSAEVLNDRR